MADSKISNLNAVTTLASGDVVPIVNNSVTKKATASQLSSYSQLGWAKYIDSQYTSSNKLSLADSVQVTLPNNANTIIRSPEGYDFFNAVTQKITAQSENDTYMVTVVFKASSPNTNNTHLDFQLVNGGVTFYERIHKSLAFYKGNNTEQNFHEVFQFYADSDFVSNGATLKIESVGGTADVWDIIFFIQRTQRYF
jgi:hypothetical protein